MVDTDRFNMFSKYNNPYIKIKALGENRTLILGLEVPRPIH